MNIKNGLDIWWIATFPQILASGQQIIVQLYILYHTRVGYSQVVKVIHSLMKYLSKPKCIPMFADN